MSMTVTAEYFTSADECPKCALTGAAVGLLAVMLLLKATMPSSSTALRLPMDETCSLSRSACSTYLPDGTRLEVTIGPLPISITSPFDIELRTNGAQGLAVNIAATDPPMGSIEVPLSLVQPDLFRGRATLPVCISGHGEWQAEVTVEKSGQLFEIPFRFETGPGGQ